MILAGLSEVWSGCKDSQFSEGQHKEKAKSFLVCDEVYVESGGGGRSVKNRRK